MKKWMWLVFVSLILIVVSFTLAVIDHRQLLSFSRHMASVTDQGTAWVDRNSWHTSVEFSRPFASPPIINVTAATAAMGDFFVADISDHGFKIELKKRSSMDLNFNWQAKWDPSSEREYLSEVAGMPDKILFSWNKQNWQAYYTGYQAYLPTEMWLDNWPQDISDDQQESFIFALLQQAQDQYNRRISCNWLDKIRWYLRQNNQVCRGDNDKKGENHWEDLDITQWETKATDLGVQIYRKVARQTRDNTANPLQELFKKTLAADISVHNNQMLDFVDTLPKAEEKSELVLLHFDTHSDIYLHADPRRNSPAEMIGDFLNQLLTQQIITEVYWVLPDWTRHQGYKDFYWQSPLPNLNEITSGVPYAEGPKNLNIYYHGNTEALYFSNVPAHIPRDQLQIIKFHKVILNELPEFSNNQNILLEFDADYFSNSGYDTSLAPAFNPSRAGLEQSLAEVAGKLVNKKAYPLYAYLCLSPKYTSLEDQAALSYLFGGVMKAKGLQDRLIGYRHNIEDGIDFSASNKLRKGVLANLLFDALVADGDFWPGDQQILLDADGGDNLEYLGFYQAIKKQLQLNDYQTESLLIKLDRLDGEANGWLNLLDLEYYAAKENSNWLLE